MKTDGWRYALEWRDPVKGWSTRLSGDDEASVRKLYAAQSRTAPRDWRIVDRATDTVITEAA